MKKILLLLSISSTALAMLAGGRPNTFSEGNNAFAGVVNPANAVWLTDRFDIGAYYVHQKSSLTNRDNNPLFPKGKLDLSYGTKNLFTTDFAFLKLFKVPFSSKTFESSVTLAGYTVPGSLKVGTKNPLPFAGTTPILVSNKTEVISAIFSIKLNQSHSFGVSVDFLRLSHLRNGFQNSDNPLQSVSPGHVTNNGTDRANGVGCSVGWRWNITKALSFGAAYVKKCDCGHFSKYRGFEPKHAKCGVARTLGGGFTYRFGGKFAARAETLWTNLADSSGANGSISQDGRLNPHKKGSKNAPGPGLQDALFINLGVGAKLHDMFVMGIGYSHRMKWARNSPYFFAQSYAQQTIFDILSLGSMLIYKRHELFLVYSYGFKNEVSGIVPETLGGGTLHSQKRNMTFSASWGYKF